MGYRYYLSLIVCLSSATVKVSGYRNCHHDTVVAYSFYKTYFTPNYYSSEDYGSGPLGTSRCEVTFEASCSLGETVRIRVKDIDLPGRDWPGDCTDDKITFYDGSTTYADQLKTVCGTEAPNDEIRSTGCHLLMTLETSHHRNIVRKLRLEYKSVDGVDGHSTYNYSSELAIIIVISIVSFAAVVTILTTIYCCACRSSHVPGVVLTQDVPSIALQMSQEQAASHTAPPLYHLGINPVQQDPYLNEQPPKYEDVVSNARNIQN